MLDSSKESIGEFLDLWGFPSFDSIENISSHTTTNSRKKKIIEDKAERNRIAQRVSSPFDIS